MLGETNGRAVAQSVYTSPLAPGASLTVEALLTALLNNVPFLAPAPAAPAGPESPAWFEAAGWQTAVLGSRPSALG